MIKKKCKECGTLIDLHAREHCEICHGNYGWWHTCDKHEDIIFRDKVKECPVCRVEATITENIEKKSNLEPSAGERLADKVNEELKYYEQAGKEWDSGNTVKGLVAKAKVESLGDKLKTEAIYIKLRSAMLAAHAEEAAIADNLKKENAKKVLKVMIVGVYENKNSSEKPFYKIGEDAYIRFIDSDISGNREIATFEYKDVKYKGQIYSDSKAEGK